MAGRACRPYTPDALIDVVQEGDRVWIHYADVFATAQRLTPDQAVGLLTAGASVLALPGAEPDSALARGVAKLAAVLGVDATQVLDVDLGGARVEVLEVLRNAVREHQRVHLDYYSYGRDTRTERDVDPYLVHAEDGSLYLFGHCHLAGAERRFRIDRIASATALSDTFEPPPLDRSAGVFQPDADDPRVVLRLEPSAAWVAETYPVEAVEQGDDGSLTVTLAVAAEPWLERLLVSLGTAGHCRGRARVADAAPAAAPPRGSWPATVERAVTDAPTPPTTPQDQRGHHRRAPSMIPATSQRSGGRAR